jgi:uncharacterized protein DUF4377
MSHLSLAALSVLIVASACSTPKAPDASSPAAPSESSDENVAPLTPADSSSAGAPGAAPTGSAQASIQTLFVRDRLAECQSEAAKKCLQVRANESEAWRNLYSPIEGFDYEESNAYELRVEVSEVANPRPDGSSRRYRLLEVVSKRASSAPTKTD